METTQWLTGCGRLSVLRSAPRASPVVGSLLLLLASTLSLMFSLRDPSSRAHTVALQSLAFFLIIFYTLYFLSLAVAITNVSRLQELLTYAGICLHSGFLARGSPKLREALKRRLWGALDKEPLVLHCRYRQLPSLNKP